MPNVRKSEFDLILWAIIILMIAFSYVWALLANDYPDLVFAFFNSIACIFAIFGLYISKRAGMSSAVNTFTITFLCIIPLFSRIYEVTYWGESSAIFYGDYTRAAAILAACIILFNFTYYFANSNKKIKYKSDNHYNINTFALILVSWMAFLAIAAKNDFSLISMVVRGGDLKSQIDIESSTFSLIFGSFIYPIPAVCFCLYSLFGKRSLAIMSFLAIPLLIGNAPTGASRFIAAAIYISVLISLFPSLKESNVKIPALIIIGILSVFPTLDQFRYYEGGFPEVRFLGIENLREGHFDSFQSITSALNYPSTFGYQFLGVLFFWIPRSVWPDKPIGSGAEYADYASLTFSNISMNFFAEGIINFGIPGALAFAVIGAIVAKKIDGSAMSISAAPRDQLISSFMIGMTVFIMRGDLLSSFSFSIGLLGSIYLVSWLCTSVRPHQS